MRTCASCQKAYPDDVRLCPVHGTALMAASQEEEQALSDTLAARQSAVAGGGGQVVRSGAVTPTLPPARGTPTPPGLRDSGGAAGSGPVSTDALIGSTLNERYDVTRKIGEGGMGVVYEAKHTLIGKRVAIKVLLDKYAQKADIVARLQQEARLASSIGHEHIVDITDFGETADGRTYVVMEFLEGESLAQLLAREGPLPPARAVAIARQVASALAAAHGKGVVHRDVKPENVFIIRRSDRDFVKVVDFGISKALKPHDGGDADSSSSPRLTHTGMVLGTPLYMSPEQARGEDDLDHRIDVYAVGVILYELLTGEVPFRGTNYLNVISQVLSVEPRPPSQTRPDLNITPAIEAVVMKAMAKDRKHRYATMAELDADLARLEKGDAVVAALSEPRLSGIAQRRRRSRTVLAWVLGVAVLIGATVAVVVPLTRSELAKPPPVESTPTSPPVTPPAVTPPIAVKPPIPKVNISVSSTPPGAEIYWDDVRKGTTPATIQFNQNDETIKLTLSLKGYADATVPFQPSKDDALSVKLRPLKKGEAQKPKHARPTLPADDKKQENTDTPDQKGWQDPPK